MAKQKGIIKVKGTLGDITFYKSIHGFIAREKGGVDGSRIANDPAYIRTRENNAEFASSSVAGKFIRSTLRPLMMNCADSLVTSRLQKLLATIKNMDSISVRGERNVGAAIHQAAAKQLLKGFDFNSNATLASVVFAPYGVDTSTGEGTFTSLRPKSGIIFPAGATHIGLTSGFARFDFNTGNAEAFFSPMQSLSISANAGNVVLTPSGTPANHANVTSIDLFLLKVEFFQMVNSIPYSLNNGTYNVLNIVEVG